MNFNNGMAAREEEEERWWEGTVGVGVLPPVFILASAVRCALPCGARLKRWSYSLPVHVFCVWAPHKLQVSNRHKFRPLNFFV
jgi:hypothetical protein